MWGGGGGWGRSNRILRIQREDGRKLGGGAAAQSTYKCDSQTQARCGKKERKVEAYVLVRGNDYTGRKGGAEKKLRRSGHQTRKESQEYVNILKAGLHQGEEKICGKNKGVGSYLKH